MKIFKITLLILCLTAVLSSCSKSRAENDASNSKIIIDSYETQLKHYADLLSTLQNELTDAKEANYILKSNYESEINALRDEISTLKQQSGDTSSEGNISNNRNDNHDIYPEQIEETSSKNLFKYEIIDQKLTLTQYVGDKASIEIPCDVDGVKITSIGDNAFKNSELKSIKIGNGVEEIGWFAFYGCRSLEKIEIPASVISVSYGAFDYCSPSLVIICEKGSYIEAYAKSWGIRTEYK